MHTIDPGLLAKQFHTRVGSQGTDQRPQVSPTGNERILLVDDEMAIVNLERQILERLGYRVTAFTSPDQALQAFRSDPGGFDLVITDLFMPDLPGDRLAADLNAIRPGIPVILFTGITSPVLPESLNLSGILLKPISRSELALRVRQALDSRCL
ncbi:MAG: response regulator [Pseudomonadota bacterium]